MKKNNQILLSILCLLFAFQLSAQDCKVFKNGVVMKDGKTMTVDKNGALTALEADMTLGNGTVVSKTGDYKLASGKKLKMKNGEAFSEDGDMLVLMDEMIAIEGFLMKDGIIMQVKGASMNVLEQDIDLESGDKLMKDGTITRTDGTKLLLREGEMINTKGETMLRKDEIVNMDGVTMRNGKMMKWEKNKLIVVDKDLILSNGAKISPNGTIIMKDGTKLVLNNSEIFNSKGEITMTKSDLITDGIFMRGGNTMILQNGKMKTLNEEIKLANGSVVSSKGVLTSSDGSKLTLEEGEIISMQGDIFLPKGGKLSNDAVDDRSVLDHIVFENGKLIMVKDGQPQFLDKDILMPNGSKVSRTGQITKKDGSKYSLKEGERIGMNGEVIVDQEKQVVDEKNYVMMKMGKMLVVKNGKELSLTSEVLLADWSKVQIDGSVLKENGQKYQLKEGERMNMDGQMMSKVNTGFTGAPSTTTPASNTSDCIQMKGGKMCIVKTGKPLPMTKEQVMPNGSKVMLNGTVVKKDGTTIAMKEGDRIDMKGEMLPKIK